DPAALRRGAPRTPRPRREAQGQAPLDGARPAALAALPFRHDRLVRAVRTRRGEAAVLEARDPPRRRPPARPPRPPPPPPDRPPPPSLPGSDPPEALPPASELRRLLARRQAPIKAVLLDQTVFAGVGNWIADEVLYQARIRPDKRAATLSAAEVAALRAR